MTELHLAFIIKAIVGCILATGATVLLIQIRHDDQIEQQRKADAAEHQFFHYKKQPLDNPGHSVK